MNMRVERGGKNTMEKGREKYHMVHGIVPYGIGIVPYGIGSLGGKTACVKRRLASFKSIDSILCKSSLGPL
jgi:hypothetical protein